MNKYNFGVKNSLVLLAIFMLFSTLSLKATTNDTIPKGSIIIDMGVVPQTYDNGLKPYGLIYELVTDYYTPIHWSISDSKSKDGTDFTHNGHDFKGGPFIILDAFRTHDVDSIIDVWETKGVITYEVISDFVAPIYKVISYIPRWTLNVENGGLVEGIFTRSEIPLTATTTAYPSTLSRCDDIFILPHADPTWEDHSNLYQWNAKYGTYPTSST